MLQEVMKQEVVEQEVVKQEVVEQEVVKQEVVSPCTATAVSPFLVLLHEVSEGVSCDF